MQFEGLNEMEAVDVAKICEDYVNHSTTNEPFTTATLSPMFM